MPPPPWPCAFRYTLISMVPEKLLESSSVDTKRGKRGGSGRQRGQDPSPAPSGAAAAAAAAGVSTRRGQKAEAGKAAAVGAAGAEASGDAGGHVGTVVGREGGTNGRVTRSRSGGESAGCTPSITKVENKRKAASGSGSGPTGKTRAGAGKAVRK
jgi:hypothetical protein